STPLAIFYTLSPLFFLILRRPPRPTPFPYTTLFRSGPRAVLPDRQHRACAHADRGGQAGLSFLLGHRGMSEVGARVRPGRRRLRSEEHTSELQSRENLVCRLLLEKKNQPVFVHDLIC